MYWKLCTRCSCATAPRNTSDRTTAQSLSPKQCRTGGLGSASNPYGSILGHPGRNAAASAGNSNQEWHRTWALDTLSRSSLTLSTSTEGLQPFARRPMRWVSKNLPVTNLTIYFPRFLFILSNYAIHHGLPDYSRMCVSRCADCQRGLTANQGLGDQVALLVPFAVQRFRTG